MKRIKLFKHWHLFIHIVRNWECLDLGVSVFWDFEYENYGVSLKFLTHTLYIQVENLAPGSKSGACRLDEV